MGTLWGIRSNEPHLAQPLGDGKSATLLERRESSGPGFALITRRSGVRIPPPLPPKRIARGPSDSGRFYLWRSSFPWSPNGGLSIGLGENGRRASALLRLAVGGWGRHATREAIVRSAGFRDGWSRRGIRIRGEPRRGPSARRFCDRDAFGARAFASFARSRIPPGVPDLLPRINIAVSSPRRSSRRSAGPVFQLQPLESTEVLHVGGHDYQLVHSRDGGNLAVRCRGRTTSFPQTCPLARVPPGSFLVVGKNRQRAANRLFQIDLDRSTLLRRTQEGDSISKLVPNDRTGRELTVVLRERLQDALVRV